MQKKKNTKIRKYQKNTTLLNFWLYSRPKYAILHARFLTWSLNFIAVFRAGFCKLHSDPNPLLCPSEVNVLFKHFELFRSTWTWTSLFIWSLKRKKNSFIRSCGSLENHTRFQTVMSTSTSIFIPKRLKNHTLCVSVAHTYSLFKGVFPAVISHRQIFLIAGSWIFSWMWETINTFIVHTYAFSLKICVNERMTSLLNVIGKKIALIRFMVLRLIAAWMASLFLPQAFTSCYLVIYVLHKESGCR